MKVSIAFEGCYDIREYINKVIGMNPILISDFCKRVEIKEMDLIMILLGGPHEIESDSVLKIEEDMREHLFTPPSKNKRCIFKVCSF